MEAKRNKYGTYQCPCCGHYTLDDKPDNTSQTCHICFWEDDVVQLNDQYYDGGANELSLNEVSRNFKEFGAIDLRFKEQVRLPLEEELKDLQMKPLLRFM